MPPRFIAKKRGTSFPVPLKKRSIVCGLSLLKDVLAHSADGADPAVGDLVPGGTGGDAVVGITHSGVVLITARANVLVHLVFLPCLAEVPLQQALEGLAVAGLVLILDSKYTTCCI